MMEFIKQSYEKRGSLLALLLLAISCSIEDLPDDPMLECILDDYIHCVQDELAGKVILVYDTQGWNDSTSYLIIMLIQQYKIDAGEILKSSYKGNTIFLHQRHITGGGAIKKDNGVPNRLAWKNTILEHEPSVPLPESFYEVHLLYNTKRRCLETTELQRPIHFTRSKCFICGD